MTTPPAVVIVPLETFDEIEKFVEEFSKQLEEPCGWPMTQDEQANFVRSFAHRLFKITRKNKEWARLRVVAQLLRIEQFERTNKLKNLQPATDPTKDGSTERRG